MKKISIYHGMAYCFPLLLFVWIADKELGLLLPKLSTCFYISTLFQFVGLLPLLAIIWKFPHPEEVELKEARKIKYVQMAIISPSILSSVIAFSVITYNKGFFLFASSLFLLFLVMISLWMSLSIIETAFKIKFKIKEQDIIKENK